MQKNTSKTLRVFFYLLILLIALLPIITGCSKGKSESSANPESEKSKKTENLLRKMEEDINSLIEELEKEFFKEVIPEEKKKEENTGQAKQEQSKEQQKEGQKSDQGKSKEGSSGGQEQKQEPEWIKNENKVEGIHGLWDNFRGEAALQGYGEDELNVFNEKLNQLTMMFTRKDLYGALSTSNDLFGTLLGYYKDPKEKAAGPAKKTLFYIRSATYKGLKGNYEESQKDLLEAVKSWEYAKAIVEDPVLNKKTEFAVKDLIEALKAKDPNLVKIKFALAQNNLKKAIEMVEKGKS